MGEGRFIGENFRGIPRVIFEELSKKAMGEFIMKFRVELLKFFFIISRKNPWGNSCNNLIRTYGKEDLEDSLGKSLEKYLDESLEKFLKKNVLITSENIFRKIRFIFLEGVSEVFFLKNFCSIHWKKEFLEKFLKNFKEIF